MLNRQWFIIYQVVALVMGVTCGTVMLTLLDIPNMLNTQANTIRLSLLQNVTVFVGVIVINQIVLTCMYFIVSKMKEEIVEKR